MKPIIAIAVLSILLALAGCNKEKPTENQTAQSSPIAAQMDALHKAKQVEQVLQNGAVQERENINQQTE
jgi:outer membrane murein-binding lipoprotein Lpp